MATEKVMRTKRGPARKRAVLGLGNAAEGITRSPAPAIADEKREQMIAEAAYYRAEKRGFVGGQELDDWLAAEAEIASAAPRSRADVH